MCSEPSQNSKMKHFFSYQKLAHIFVNWIKGKIPKERIKTSVASEMFKTENHCRSPQVADATDGRKRGLRTLKSTLSLKTLKRTLSLSTLKRTLLLRTLKRLNQAIVIIFLFLMTMIKYWHHHVGYSGSDREL